MYSKNVTLRQFLTIVVHIHMYHILLSAQVLTGNNLTDCIISNLK